MPLLKMVTVVVSSGWVCSRFSAAWSWSKIWCAGVAYAVPAVVVAHRAAAVEAVVGVDRLAVVRLVAVQRRLDDRRGRVRDALLAQVGLDAPVRVEDGQVRVVQGQADAGGRAPAQRQQLRLSPPASVSR